MGDLFDLLLDEERLQNSRDALRQSVLERRHRVIDLLGELRIFIGLPGEPARRSRARPRPALFGGERRRGFRARRREAFLPAALQRLFDPRFDVGRRREDPRLQQYALALDRRSIGVGSAFPNWLRYCAIGIGFMHSLPGGSIA